jgi:glycosyltransferase involved in cell wall biosynthesis
MKAAVTVVIPVLNGAATIGDLLTALGGQVNVPAGTETIVVDNGSTDGTQDIVRRFPVRLAHEARRGPGAARNCGLHAAGGDVVAFIDADAMPTRRWLAALIAPFSDPQTLVVGGRILAFRSETPAERYMASIGMFDPKNNITRELFPFAVTMNMAVRRTIALELGGFAEDMPTAEDMDFSLRLTQRFGHRLVYQPQAVVMHRGRQGDAALWRQAWTYGEGMADMYLRYHELVRWDAGKSLRVALSVGQRAAQAGVLRAGRWLRLGDAEKAEVASYHARWTWWFWRGFFSMHRSGRRRVP